MVAKDPDGSILVAAFFAAVLFAPICEEITFRLLLQGWLEKWEDARLGWRRMAAPEIATEPTPLQADAMVPIEPSPEPFVADDADVASAPAPELSPIHGPFGLPHGWAPILVSSLLFALAHFGIGPDPIPLFLLALVLGYVYQRTHRIVPCMVTHALFNSLTLVALWRMLSTGEPVGP
jgi:membrane protease YdiL (CAAX protease family)